MREFDYSAFERPEQPPLPPDLEMIGEPVQRPDGRYVTMYRDDGGIQVEVGTATEYTKITFYITDEVLQLGNGSLMYGVMRITRASVQQDLSYLDGDLEYYYENYPGRPLDNELHPEHYSDSSGS